MAMSRRECVFVDPSLASRLMTVRDLSIRKVCRFQSTSDHRRAQSSPLLAPVIAASAIALPNTWPVSAAAWINFCTVAVSGADADRRSMTGNVAFSAGLPRIRSHLTAWSSAAESME